MIHALDFGSLKRFLKTRGNKSTVGFLWVSAGAPPVSCATAPHCVPPTAPTLSPRWPLPCTPDQPPPCPPDGPCPVPPTAPLNGSRPRQRTSTASCYQGPGAHVSAPPPRAPATCWSVQSLGTHRREGSVACWTAGLGAGSRVSSEDTRRAIREDTCQVRPPIISGIPSSGELSTARRFPCPARPARGAGRPAVLPAAPERRAGSSPRAHSPPDPRQRRRGAPAGISAGTQAAGDRSVPIPREPRAPRTSSRSCRSPRGRGWL